MKNLTQTLFALFCLSALPACAQIKYPAKITVRVVDDTGTPITAGAVRASTFSKWIRGEGFGYDEYEHFDAPLNKEGVAEIDMLMLRKDFGYWPMVDEKHYYSGGGGRYRFKQVENLRWEPWNPQLEIVVPRVLNPIPLYARRMGGGPDLELPTVGPIGFDLMVSDWVAPHGKGKQADFVFERKTIIPAADLNGAFDSIFTITFANPGDGIQSHLASPKRRLLELPRQAPEDGYEPKLSKRISRAAEGASIEYATREDQNYFFRVRTVLDPNGKVISALYGKIPGDIQFFAGSSPKGYAKFIYYLNPTSLDRNLEFDPKRNLLPDTVSGTNITEP